MRVQKQKQNVSVVLLFLEEFPTSSADLFQEIRENEIWTHFEICVGGINYWILELCGADVKQPKSRFEKTQM